MQFKVGDRVEVLKPAQGTGFSQKNNIGRGTVEAINDDVSEVCVRVDTNDLAWWYDIESVRPLTPSITVGTQVRLTGVVTYGESSLRDTVRVDVKGDTAVWVAPSLCEVIRQPFKRGEVVYFEDHDITCVVLEDEQNGRMLLIEAGEGKYATYVDAAKYERRP